MESIEPNLKSATNPLAELTQKSQDSTCMKIVRDEIFVQGLFQTAINPLNGGKCHKGQPVLHS